MFHIPGIIASVFETNGLQSTDGLRAFSPHLTVAKVRRDKSHVRLKQEMYADMLDIEFGSEHVTELELLSMTLPVDKDGYYHCFQNCTFDELL